jgi:hypothetical protein
LGFAVGAAFAAGLGFATGVAAAGGHLMNLPFASLQAGAAATGDAVIAIAARASAKRYISDSSPVERQQTAPGTAEGQDLRPYSVRNLVRTGTIFTVAHRACSNDRPPRQANPPGAFGTHDAYRQNPVFCHSLAT